MMSRKTYLAAFLAAALLLAAGCGQTAPDVPEVVPVQADAESKEEKAPAAPEAEPAGEQGTPDTSEAGAASSAPEPAAVSKPEQAEADSSPEQDTDAAETQAESAGNDAGAAERAEAEAAEPEMLTFIDAWDEWHTVTIDPEAEKHTYDWDCLQNDGTSISYTGDDRYTLRRGVDVSEHQGAIDWAQVRAEGYEFALIRIAYRGYGEEGVLVPDDMFRTNIEQAQAAGLDVGVYLFSQAVNEEEAEEEAAMVVSLLEGYDLQLPVVFDPEHIRDDAARTDDVTGEQFTKNALVFCEAVETAGYQPMIYANMIWESMVFDLKQLQQYPVWYADYEPAPQTPYAFSFWQYSEKGSVSGIAGVVDLDVQFISQ